MAGFSLEKGNFTKMSPNVYQYRTPILVKAKRGWYVEYYFQIPENFKHKYNIKAKWERFQVREDMNRRKGQEKEIYAIWLREWVEGKLKEGFNPFTNSIEKIAKDQSGIEEKKFLSAEDALRMFLEEWKTRGLDPVNTYPKYERVVTRLIEWLIKKTIALYPIQDITQNHIEAFLKDMKKEHGFGNREYNNHYDFTRTAFNFLLKKKFITEAPTAGIDKQKANTTKHRYFDEKSLQAITKAMLNTDPYLYMAFQTVYYLCVRSEKELKFLKVGNIMWEQNKILAEITKGKAERYINLDPKLRELFIKQGIDKYPADHYIFGVEGHPAPKPFGRGFLSKRFMKARKLAGLSSDFTIYGAKHTRIIHLNQDGASDSDIIGLTGHKDYEAFAKYMRDLGLDVNVEKLNRISRTI